MLVRKRPVRRGQLISPFGVGAITDFRNDEALMCAGIDAWFQEDPPGDLRVNEERLQARLGCDYFVLPPDFSENRGGPKIRIPYVRFPRWHYCPRCFRMREAQLFGDQPTCSACSGEGRWKRRMIPIRIVAACEHGHIQDFPFQEWIGCSCDESAELYFKSGRSAASIQGTKIECRKCGKVQSLAGAFQPAALAARGAHCSGARPWLGITEGTGECVQPLRTLQRGASNLYFPVVRSSIYVPAELSAVDPKIRKMLEDPAKWAALTSATVDGKPNETAIRMLAQMNSIDPDALLESVSAKMATGEQQKKTAQATEEEFRRQEFDVLRAGSSDHRSDLLCEVLPGTRYGLLADFVRSVGLVRKLRETRVLTGFARVNPPGGSSDVEQALSRAPHPRWLPATVVRGEGIFIEFDDSVISEWAAQAEVRSRTKMLISGYDAQRAARNLLPRGIDSRFLLVHTLAHALIRELTFLCGYGSSALRERIYCSLDDPGRPMLGLLIYTASGDSEGTLGGLVSQAEEGKLEALFSAMFRRSMWCSNDPVCIESQPRGAGQMNLAACHGCTLLPETSCEEGNRLLDRALLVGTPENGKLGFFSKIWSPATSSPA
ncbi:DrmB family protein [Tsuneonella sp. SYSU-LHT278]|uniref:DrmB family protein n=1 Tax=Tsuneonella sediminis TaxID=3416089 RepID=UPI003F7A1BB5